MTGSLQIIIFIYHVLEKIIQDKPSEEQMLDCKFSKYFIICPQIFPGLALENKY